MTELSIEQVRAFRLHSHHLDRVYEKSDLTELAGSCGMQNTPPGAWETSVYNRVPDCSLTELEHLLYKEKLFVQAWSLRGAPVVFPVSKSDVFLFALRPEGDEPWIYTAGISLALDFLQMSFNELLELLLQVIPKLDDTLIVSKTVLDQTLADWMAPLLPAGKLALWNHPSMYGSPDKQTVGGAVVSFLLRPCAFCGLVVFGERDGVSPTFTSYKSWTGHALEGSEDAGRQLVRNYLHCYGPATTDHFASWLGCSGRQARRLWNSVSEEIESVLVFGKKAWILSSDKEALLSPAPIQRDFLLLGGHDPFLDQRDRMILQPDKSLHRKIWTFVTNPGVVLYRGEIVGIWTSKKKNAGMEIKMDLWSERCNKEKLQALAERYAGFRRQKLLSLEL